MDLQKIMEWFGYDVMITCEVVTKDKMNEIEQGREKPNPYPSFNITGENFETPTVSAQWIEQQVERVVQNIANQLVDHVNQQVGQLEAIVSKNTNMNDKGRTEIDLTDIALYKLHRMFWDFLTNRWGCTQAP